MEMFEIHMYICTCVKRNQIEQMLRYGSQKGFCIIFYKDGIYLCNGNGTVGTRHSPFHGELNGPFNG